MGKCQALCVFCMRKILHCLSGMRIFRFFKGFRVFCMWWNTWNPLKNTSLLSEVMAHSGISGGFSSDHSHARFMVYGVFDWGGVRVSWCPSIRLLALCERNQAVTGGFPSLKASDAGLSFFGDDVLWFLSICIYICPKCFTSSGECRWLNMIQYEDVKWLEIPLCR